MGETRSGSRHQISGRSLSSAPAALVVPRVPTFAVDNGFWYSIPSHLAESVTIGAQVRVPLGGRKVRGFVTKVVAEREGTLKDVLAVSGDQPIFDPKLLRSLQWAASHYVAPVAAVLDKSSPPTLPGPRPARQPPLGGARQVPYGLDGFVSAVAAGERRPAVALVTDWRDPVWLGALSPVLAEGLSCLMVVPTVRELEVVEKMARDMYGDNVLAIPDAPGSAVTKAWVEASRGTRVVVGTPLVAAWKVDHLALGIVIEEGRRAMKERQTPTIHVREMMRTRSRIEGFGSMFVGPTPSVELIAAGAEIHNGSRPWGLVEVVDRNEDPPGGGFLSERTVSAIRTVSAGGGEVFVFTHRRVADSSVRCVKCRAVRVCLQCGSHVGSNQACPRCGAEAGNCPRCGGQSFESMGSVPARLMAELANRVGQGVAGEPGSGRRVVVGTERDLAGMEGFDLAVAVDVDALLFGRNFRAAEEALRVLARVVRSVRRGHGSRAILQTSSPDTALIAALRRADPVPYLEGVLAERARDGFPPATEMMALEVRSDLDGLATDLITGLAGNMVVGSLQTETGNRWLLQGDLNLIKPELRSIVQRLRDSGASVRVDVDPIDL